MNWIRENAVGLFIAAVLIVVGVGGCFLLLGSIGAYEIYKYSTKPQPVIAVDPVKAALDGLYHEANRVDSTVVPYVEKNHFSIYMPRQYVKAASIKQWETNVQKQLDKVKHPLKLAPDGYVNSRITVVDKKMRVVAQAKLVDRKTNKAAGTWVVPFESGMNEKELIKWADEYRQTFENIRTATASGVTLATTGTASLPGFKTPPMPEQIQKIDPP